MNISTLILFVFGFVGLIIGGELLVRGASRLAAAAGIPPLIVGLTVVAFGTSSPEIAVMTQAAFGGQSELIIGNVVGSNIANVLLILGLSAMAAPLIVPRRLIRLEVSADDSGLVRDAAYGARRPRQPFGRRDSVRRIPDASPVYAPRAARSRASRSERRKAPRRNWKDWAPNVSLVIRRAGAAGDQLELAGGRRRRTGARAGRE